MKETLHFNVTFLSFEKQSLTRALRVSRESNENGDDKRSLDSLTVLMFGSSTLFHDVGVVVGEETWAFRSSRFLPRTVINIATQRWR